MVFQPASTRPKTDSVPDRLSSWRGRIRGRSRFEETALAKSRAGITICALFDGWILSNPARAVFGSFEFELWQLRLG
jgi:hypothetical protein